MLYAFVCRITLFDTMRFMFFLHAYQHYGEPPRSPEREGTRPARLRKREDVVEGRLLVCSAAGEQRGGEQRRAPDSVLQRDRYHAPPPSCPGTRGSRAQGWRRAQGPDANELPHKLLSIRVPAASDLRSQDAKALGSSASQLGVGGVFAVLGIGPTDGSSFTSATA